MIAAKHAEEDMQKEKEKSVFSRLPAINQKIHPVDIADV